MLEYVMDLSRSFDVFDPTKFNTPVHIIGCGATGSRIFQSLIEWGVSSPIHLWDFDKVEDHNLPNQIFNQDAIGELKTDSCLMWYDWKIGKECDHVIPHNEKFVRQPVSGVIFLMVDSMEQRKKIGRWLKIQPIDLVIETRTSASHGNIYTWTPSQHEQWEATLIDDDQADMTACGTVLSTGATASIFANLATWQLINYIHDEGVDECVNIFLDPLIVARQSYEKLLV